jgi:hypothetical protein
MPGTRLGFSIYGWQKGTATDQQDLNLGVQKILADLVLQRGWRMLAELGRLAAQVTGRSGR